MAGKTLVIGLELGDGRLLYQWAKEGHLPALAALIDAGAWGRSRPRPVSSTFRLGHRSTPRRPRGARRLLHLSAGAGSPGLSAVSRRSLRPADLLAAARRRRPPLRRARRALHPPGTGVRPHPGVRLGHLGALSPPRSTPASVLGDLESACGKYPLGLEAHDLGFNHSIPRAPSGAWSTRCGARPRRRLAHAPRRLRPGHDGVRREPRRRPLLLESDGDQHLMRALYAELDRAIAGLVEAAGPGAAVFVVSGDAIGPNHAGWHLCPGARPLGTSPRRRPRHPTTPARRSIPGRSGACGARPVAEGFSKNLGADAADRAARQARPTRRHRDDRLAPTRAYCLPTDLEGSIRIDLQGRERRARSRRRRVRGGVRDLSRRSKS